MKYFILFVLFISGYAKAQSEFEHSDWATWNLSGKVKSITEYEIRTIKKKIKRKKHVFIKDTVGIRNYVFYPDGKLKYLKFIVNDGSFSGHPEYSYDTTGFISSYKAHTTYREEMYSYTFSNGRVVMKQSQDTLLRSDYITFEYDDMGRIIGKVHHADSTSLFSKIQYTYLPTGEQEYERTVCCDSSGNDFANWVGIKYSYFDNGLLAVEEQFYNQTEKKHMHFYSYDSVGQRSVDSSRYTYYDDYLGWKTGASATKFWYDAHGNLTKLYFTSYGPFLLRDTWLWEYTYDTTGNWLTKTELLGYEHKRERIIEYFE